MKKSIWFTLILLVLFILNINFILADNLYKYDSLNLGLEVNGSFDLITENENFKINQITVELLLFPKNDFRQSLIDFETEGTIEDKKIVFNWNNPTIETKTFNYNVEIDTQNSRNQVNRKIKFPLTETYELEKYLVPTETIDSNNPEIIKKASELAEGEDDLFKVVFNLANWVDDNVEYDLNTLTATASQKASWVLENREGVCDEMTSLFIAMARSLGIPAKFVSGISYSTSDLFDEPWQPHGWAEVYFPTIGWVSFDITFGEYGYIDVTHIKLRDNPDPQEAAVKYEWISNNVNLKSNKLDFNTRVLSKGDIYSENLLIEQEILSDNVNFGSYNLIKGIVKNTADYYAATTLQLAVPPQIKIIGDNKRTILLHPQEVRETYWIIKVPNDLKKGYWYEFPTYIYSEKNVSITGQFKAEMGQNDYSKLEIEKLIIKDEEKSYSRKVSFDCNYPTKIKINEKVKIICKVKNSGNTNLKRINFCIESSCKLVDLPIGQSIENSVIVQENKPGYKKIIISAENELIEKRTSLELTIFDLPQIKINLDYQKKINYKENFEMKVVLNKVSFRIPKNIIISIKGAGIENSWEVKELQDKEVLTLKIKDYPTTKNNKFKILTTWQEDGMDYSDKKEVVIIGKPSNFLESVKMLLNNLLKIFS